MFLFSFSAKFRKWTDRLWRQLTKKYALFFVASIRIVTKWRDKTSVETTSSMSVERTKCIKYGRNKEARAEKCKHAKHEVWKKSNKWRNTITIFERLKKAKKTSKCLNHTFQSGQWHITHKLSKCPFIFIFHASDFIFNRLKIKEKLCINSLVFSWTVYNSGTNWEILRHNTTSILLDDLSRQFVYTKLLKNWVRKFTRFFSSIRRVRQNQNKTFWREF